MFDAYEVAIKLKLIDHFSPIMAMVTNRLIAANVHAEKLQKNLDGVGKLFKAGVLTTGAGFGIAMALKASTNEAVRYEQQLNKLKALNLDSRFGASTTANLTKKAEEISKNTKGISNTESLRLVTESQSITGNVDHTIEIAPVLAQLKFGMETYMSAGGKGEGHGAQAEKQFNDIVKVMEMRGLMRDFNPEKLDRMADLFAKNYVASGGMVKPSDFLAMMKTAGVAGKSVSDDFMFALGHIMQEKGGSRSGTQLMSAYQNLVAGRTTQQVAEQLQKYSLLKPGSIEYGKTGHIKKVAPEALKEAELFQANPLDFLNKFLVPALAAKHVDINDQKKVLPIINQLASSRTGADFLAQLYLERTQIGNYMDQAKNAYGYKQLYDQAGKSTTGQKTDLESQVDNLELEFGKTSLPILKAALEQAIPLVKELGEWLGKNPDGLKVLVKSIAGLSIAMMVSGPLMVLGSGLKLLSIGGKLLSGPLGDFAVAMAMRGAGGASGIATLAGNLGTVGGQLGMLTRAAGVFMAAYAGWKLGEFIGNKVDKNIQESSGYGLSSTRDWLAHTWFGKKTGIFDFGKDEGLHFVQAPSQTKKNQDAPTALADYSNEGRNFVMPGAQKDNRAKNSNASKGVDFKAELQKNTHFSDAQAASIGNIIASKLNGAKFQVDGQTFGNLVIDSLGVSSMSPSTGVSSFDSRLSPPRSDYSIR